MADNDSIVDIGIAPVSGEVALKKQKAVRVETLLNEINKSFALTLYGNNAVILKTDEENIRYLNSDTFLLLMKNRVMALGGQQAPMKLGPLWLSWDKRRYYDDVVFYPGDTSDRNVYNLWKGFAYEPDPSGSCSLFLDHIRANVCGDNEQNYNWLLDWMADAVQKPYRKNWTALLLESKEEGTGKGFFANHFGKLFGRHFGAYSKPNQLLGQFNSHLEDKLIVFLDEGSLVEKHAYDFAKSLISEPTLNIEPKGRSMREVHSYHRIIMASNDEHIIRASTYDRRWMVLRVLPHSKNNLAYFDAINKQLSHEGGYEALMHLLMTRQYDEYNVKRVIETEAKSFQKEQNLPNYMEWWKNCLAIGRMGEEEWPFRVTSRDFYRNYISWCDSMHINRRESEHWLTRRLNDKAGTSFARLGNGSSTFYDLPELWEARRNLEEALGYIIRW